MNTSKEIKDFLNQKKWSIKCSRIEHYLEEHDINLRRCSIKETSDYWWGSRRNRTEKHIQNIGTISYGRTYSYLFIYVPMDEIFFYEPI
jgi:hypothetical protein